MESKKLSNRKKLDYEKPGIKEEVTLEQKALACRGKEGSNLDCTKAPGTYGAWWS